MITYLAITDIFPINIYTLHRNNLDTVAVTNNSDLAIRNMVRTDISKSPNCQTVDRKWAFRLFPIS